MEKYLEKNFKIDYKVTLKKEVLLEVMAGVIADMLNYMRIHKISIDDEKNENVIHLFELVKIKNSITKPDTMKEILELQKKINKEKQKVEKLVA